ncbi:sortase domain-bontaining protein [Macrococcoides canis]|uniref:Sortase n=1 Tax=Macrococcoides canis TaxID=1855823 RepID=A0A4R6C293_9STAP|nr:MULTISPECIES: sortase [Macrococcus]TDM15175.1 sortase [Macrococcus canis]TDM29316.1 sortase [Macrococcus canis]TDM31992.1 sortase [Macrococcus canis]TDM38945.1 sortase [Macrococcus goetzii]TDM39922.1 sortase [Macrococcus canis]
MTEYELLVQRYQERKYFIKFITLIILVLILGISLLFLAKPFNIRILVPGTIHRALYMTENLSEEKLAINNKSYSTYDISKIEEYDRVPINSFIDKKRVVGLITIPEIHKEIPITKGLDDNQLNVSVGTAKKESDMGKANYVIAGYSIIDSDELFSNIDQISIYSSIYVTDKNVIYEYSVTDKLHKLNSISSAIYSEEEGKLTLITKKSGQYTIVEGKLINKYQYDSPPKLYKLRS